MGAALSDVLWLFSLSLRVERDSSSLSMLSRNVLLDFATLFALGDMTFHSAMEASAAARAFAAMASAVAWAAEIEDTEEASFPSFFAPFK